MRKCGDEVRELLHDGCPVACLGDAPFAYVNVFTSHVNVGFFHGASLPDPARLLQGTGKYMRHIKLKPGNAHKRRSPKRANRCGLRRHKGPRRKRLATTNALMAPVSRSCSLSFRNETRNAGIHHWIQPLSGLNSIDFLKRVCRKGRDVEILSRASRTPGRG